MEKITFKIIDTDLRTIKESKEGILELHDDYLFCFVSYTSYEPPDTDLPEIKTDIVYFNHLYMDKELIDSMDFYFSHQSKKICLTINCGASTISIFYDDWKKAKEVLSKIKNWKYPEYTREPLLAK